MEGMTGAVGRDFSVRYQIDKSVFSPSSGYHSGAQRLAMSMLVTAARDVRDDRNGFGRHPDAIAWLKNPEEGTLSLRCCCEVLFSDDVDPIEIGAHILAYPDALAAIKIP